MQKNKNKVNVIKFPRQSSRRRFGVGMAKVSSVCPSVRHSSRRIHMDKPLKLTRSAGKNAKFGIWLPVFGLLILILVFASQIIFSGNSNMQKGMVLGEEEKKEDVSDKAPYIDEEIFWPSGDLSFRYLNAKHKRPEVLPDNYIYRRVYENVDIWMQFSDFSLRQKLLLLRPQHPQIFSWQMPDLQGWQIEIKKGSLSFYKKDPSFAGGLKLIYFVPTPYIEDNEGQRSVKAARFKLDGDILQLILDEDWLKGASYPVSLDFTVNRR